jgi:hypothetical protein
MTARPATTSIPPFSPFVVNKIPRSFLQHSSGRDVLPNTVPQCMPILQWRHLNDLPISPFGDSHHRPPKPSGLFFQAITDMIERLATARRKTLQWLNSRYFYGRVVSSTSSAVTTPQLTCLQATTTHIHFPLRDGYHYATHHEVQLLL